MKLVGFAEIARFTDIAEHYNKIQECIPLLFLDILKAILLGIIEGITEWLPISSTGHMILADELIRLDVSKEFMEMFLVVVQLGAILAVVILYFQKLNPFSRAKTPKEQRKTWHLWFKVVIACAPAAIIGIPLDDKIDELFYNYITVAITLILYGVLFIALESRNRGRKFPIRSLSALSYRTAAIIGGFQVLALIPGTSRSGATILGAMLIGTSRAVAAEFSFFLAIPVMFGASAIKLLKFGSVFTGTELVLLFFGMVSAFLTSLVAIRFLVSYVKKRDFTAFGYYRIVLGVIVLVFFFAS